MCSEAVAKQTFGNFDAEEIKCRMSYIFHEISQDILKFLAIFWCGAWKDQH